jgi:hypothetical protein
MIAVDGIRGIGFARRTFQAACIAAAGWLPRPDSASAFSAAEADQVFTAYHGSFSMGSLPTTRAIGAAPNSMMTSYG